MSSTALAATPTVPLPLTDVSAVPTGSPDGLCCAPLARAALEHDDAVVLARVLKAVAEPTRLRLISLMCAEEGGEACVCDLVDAVDLSQPTVSHHLKVLMDAGIVTREKRGVWAYYAVVPRCMDALSDVFRMGREA
ncbi:ArsR/SmtB family transcription factor [Cellulomonas soli]